MANKRVTSNRSNDGSGHGHTNMHAIISTHTERVQIKLPYPKTRLEASCPSKEDFIPKLAAKLTARS